MSAPRDADTILTAWLEEGPTELPEPTRRAIAVTTRTTRQTRRAFRVPWRLPPMNPLPRFALAAVAIVALTGGALYLLSPGSQEVGGPSPAPSSAPLSPAPQGTVPVNWTTYTSSRFAYSIDYPTDWVVTPGTQDWLSGGLHPDASNQDKFSASPSSARVSVSSSVLKADAAAGAEKLAELDRINAAICQLPNRHDITLDGVAARQEDFLCLGTDYGIEVAVVNEGRFYQIDLFSHTPIGETDRAIFDRFLASFRFAAPAVAWQAFTSDRFGYALELPGEWAISTLVDDLPDDVYPGPESAYGDRWDPPVTRSPWFVIAVRDPAPEPIEDWVATYTAGLTAICGASDPVNVPVDAETGDLRTGSCFPGVSVVDVLVVRDGRVYTITISGATRDAEANRALFDQILATFRFTG